MKKILPLLFGLLYVSKAFGQLQKDVAKILAIKDFNLLEKRIDKVPNHYKNTKVSWSYSRELTPRYRESIVYIEKTVPDKKDARTGTVYTFRITLLTTKGAIIFYNFSEKKYRKAVNKWNTYGETEWLEYFETISKFKSCSGYSAFERDFINLFQVNIKEKELFVENLVYGTHCGLGGTKPEERVKLDKLVKSRNKPMLVEWLQSGNTEKQVYAVDGLWQLSKVGIKLTSEELKMVNFVKNKKGNLNTCSGCIFSNWSITDMTKKFNF